jgi:hypothetical protein
MEMVMLAAIVVDAAAVAALLWCLRRSARERELGLALQRETLERLRADIAQLVGDAEARTRDLDDALARRETRLRELLATGGPAERPDHAEARLRRQLAASARSPKGASAPPG